MSSSSGRTAALLAVGGLVVLRSGQLRATRSVLEQWDVVRRLELARDEWRHSERDPQKPWSRRTLVFSELKTSGGFKSFGVHSTRDEQGWEMGMLRCRSCGQWCSTLKTSPGVGRYLPGEGVDCSSPPVTHALSAVPPRRISSPSVYSPGRTLTVVCLHTCGGAGVRPGQGWRRLCLSDWRHPLPRASLAVVSRCFAALFAPADSVQERAVFRVPLGCGCCKEGC